MSEEDKYVERCVHPVLEKLGESLAAVMPDDIDVFVLAWLENGGKCPKDRQTKPAPVESRKQYVQKQISPLLWQLTYECLTSRPTDVSKFLIEKIRKKIHRQENHGASGGPGGSSSGHGGAAPSGPGHHHKIRSKDRQHSGGTEEDDSDEQHSSGDEVNEEEMARLQMLMNDRRIGVSAEKMTQSELKNWKAPSYQKTPEQREELRGLIRRSKDSKMHMLFGLVSEDTLEKVVDAVQLQKTSKETDVITQGSQGEYFYIVKRGKFDILINVPEGGQKKVWEAGPGFAFGELALMYNAPRSATIRATEDSEVWALDRVSFRMLVVMAQEQRMIEIISFLKKVNIFETLSAGELARLGEVVQEEDFELDEAIITQGEVDSNMFIVMRGSAVACIQGEEGEIEVMSYGPADYFGEIAMLRGVPRKASVYATSQEPCVCLMIDEPSFRRVLGPVKDILFRKASLYSSYADFIGEDGDHGPSVAQASSSANKGVAKVKRKREQKKLISESQSMGLRKAKKEESSEVEKEPETLKEKVALDFKRPSLVEPSDNFKVNQATLSIFGGLKADQKFMDDKPFHVYCSNASGSGKTSEKSSSSSSNNSVHISKLPDADQGIVGGYDYSYNVQPYPLKNPTNTAMLVQKGQKSSADPTPNQDNMFYHSLDNGVLLVGCCDGHGPFGHLVSYRTVQTIPYYIQKSEHYCKDWKLCFEEAFLKAQEDLIDFEQKQNLSFSVSGTTATVMVRHEQTVHIAWVGDSNVMLASWNRNNSTELFTSTAHLPEKAEEKARIEATGLAEVREAGENTGSYRIYLKNENIPGLTMSRALGDFMLGRGAGVICTPEYSKFQMQPSDEWYVILASDGIWEFLTSEEVVKFTSKKLRLKGPKETVRNLTESSRKRWKHMEGDYCDDISCCIIMFNQKNEGNANHFVHLNTKKDD